MVATSFGVVHENIHAVAVRHVSVELLEGGM